MALLEAHRAGARAKTKDGYLPLHGASQRSFCACGFFLRHAVFAEVFFSKRVKNCSNFFSVCCACAVFFSNCATQTTIFTTQTTLSKNSKKNKIASLRYNICYFGDAFDNTDIVASWGHVMTYELVTEPKLPKKVCCKKLFPLIMLIGTNVRFTKMQKGFFWVPRLVCNDDDVGNSDLSCLGRCTSSTKVDILIHSTRVSGNQFPVGHTLVDNICSELLRLHYTDFTVTNDATH